ncbi:hypothetical protein GCWU000325_01487 [Alloprevotella tannerae ATCC 51259]|uniref:Uncharacterized protein n=1 Tax=Alloprevotella tannerae ATCC 51259 TaxID=626522 RepID=C9LGY6_9BACT|nr:hypothetical protein GCWU000325_01487 [Alloprevotella tannerae ATCC 51259]
MFNFDLEIWMLHSLRLIAEMQFRVLYRLCACLVYRLSRFGVLST